MRIVPDTAGEDRRVGRDGRLAEVALSGEAVAAAAGWVVAVVGAAA
jgi:hypothetical protein